MSIDDVIEIDQNSHLGGSGSVGLVETHQWTSDVPLMLDCGRTLSPITQVYETYGQLSPQRDNAILIFHALTGDAHAAGYHERTDRRPGWWDIMIGPGKAIDTDRYFVICANVLGGCKGTTGPGSVNPQTGAPYGLDFPILTLSDMVRAQERLVTHLGIERLFSVVGGSMGGMMALDWALRYPDRVASVVAIASTARFPAQGIAFNEVGRQAIMADPDWRHGDYYGGRSPEAGLAVARMIAHITYLSNTQMHNKFGRRLQDRDQLGYNFGTEFQVESYLRYQGNAFVRRFDANTYLYISKAIDYFDITNGKGSLVEALEEYRAETLVVSFSSDWLLSTEQSRELVRALQANGVPTTFMEITSDYGHDAFFLPNPELSHAVNRFLANVSNPVTPRSTAA
ncbi:MAG: homoserine O-acetyltransferase MetX [Anaerolineae bacterium]|jgi:homoserine O-acetyltransferase|nr:homoserine O-acetyltransferase [Chloroflexota bacterium]